MTAARTDGALFGPLIAGKVRHTAVDQSGSCGDLDADGAQVFIARYAATDDTGPRTVIYGRLSPDLASLERLDGPEPGVVPVADDGSFLLVSSTDTRNDQLRLRLVDRTGKVRLRGL